MEEITITQSVFHHIAWGTSISIYFWLVGASAGSFVISSFGWVFGIKRFKPLAMTASVTAIFMLLLVPILLIWDLLILTYPMAMIVYTFFVLRNNEKWAKVFGIVAIVLALSTHWYTGVVMELNPGRFLNHTALAPLLFLTGAFISGIGLLILILWIQNMIVAAEKRIEWTLIREMGQYMMYGLVFDAFLLFLELLQSLYGSSSAVLAHEAVLMGVFRFPYVWMEIIIGLVIPFFILVTPLKKHKAFLILAACMVCFGVYGMRIWWVMGGQYLQTFY
jgi:molybdopterin-containing oxidoreductase family membrane subunit